jgi:hypothetical protein
MHTLTSTEALAPVVNSGILTATEFANAINRRDYEGMNNLMAETFLLVTGSKLIIQGKNAVSNYWKKLLEEMPGYYLEIINDTKHSDKILLMGQEVSEPKETRNYTVWEVKAENNKLSSSSEITFNA